MQRNSPYYNPSNLLQLLQFTRTANQIAHSDKLLPCYAKAIDIIIKQNPSRSQRSVSL